MSTEPAPRGRPRDAALHGRILEAARTIAARDGARAVTATAIADEAGTGKPSLYLRFPTGAPAVLAAALAELELSPVHRYRATEALEHLRILEELDTGGFLSALIAAPEWRAAVVRRLSDLTEAEELEGSELAAAADREASEHRELG